MNLLAETARAINGWECLVALGFFPFVAYVVRTICQSDKAEHARIAESILKGEADAIWKSETTTTTTPITKEKDA
jgi:hypothetical protein